MSAPRTHCPCGTPLTPETRFNHEAVCRPCGTLKAREAYRRHIAKYPKGMTAMDRTETRTCRLGIYMTDDERHRIGAAATQAGKRIAPWVRTTILQHISTAPRGISVEEIQLQLGSLYDFTIEQHTQSSTALSTHVLDVVGGLLEQIELETN